MKAFIASISLLVLVSATSFGIGGPIGSPQIGHRTGINESQKKQVSALLAYMQNDLKFIKGSWINEFSTQWFGGDPVKVSRFICLLQEAEVWEVQVGFRDFGEQESAFLLHQNYSGTLSIEINSGRDDFLLKHFGKHLPQPGLILPVPKPIKLKAEEVGADQPATAPESKPEGKDKPESEGRSQ